MTGLRLFHVSETAGLAQFQPRPPPSRESGVTGDVVWAVAESHLVNFLTPRDCPRITFHAGPATQEADRTGLLMGAHRVVAFPIEWLDRVNGCTLSIYEMPPATFVEALPEAGYWISRESVTPLSERRQGALIPAILAAGAELRVLLDFWPLCDAVAASSLQFSILRKRNARPRPVGDR